MAAQPEPKVKKTKKSSYKPLSQLNQDRLTELNRVEKPETTSRVFHYGLAHKARLRHNVNVWFRDHRHSIAVLQRQQRAVQHQMGRLQHDVRRVRRDEYKRRQEEIRTKLTRLQLRLLQRRVVEQFQRNAMTKMAARGEQSLVALRMMGLKSGHVTGHQLNSSASTSAAAAASPHTCADDTQKTQALADRRKSEPSLPNRKENGDSGVSAFTSNKDFRSKSGSQKTENLQQKSVRRFSESDVGKEGEAEGVDSASPQSQRPAWEDSLSPLAAGMNNLDIIPEDAPATKESDGGDLQGKLPSPQNLKSSASKESRVNSRVLEVRKHRPHSPKTHEISRPRRATLGTIPQTTKLKTLSPIAPNASHTSGTADQEQDDPGQSSGSTLTESPPQTQNFEQDFSVMDSNSQNSSEAAEENSQQNGEKDAQKINSPPQQESKTQGKRSEMDREKKKKNTTTEKDNKRETNKETKGEEKVAGKEPSLSEQEVFSFVPSRAKVMEDVGQMLGEEEKEEEGEEGQGLLWKGGRQGAKELPSLAARVRQQRKREARRRSQLLDREPLVQYYRSVRGTLEPLLSEPCRKSFPFPSGRAQYEQHKLLREELQKEVDRKNNINNFFSQIFHQHTEAAKPPAQETGGNAGKSGAGGKAGPMNLLLQMRQQGRRNSRRTSIQQLAACQYLRLHDWEAKGRKKQDDPGPVERSWATAENRLKAGFLAMDFTGQR